MATASHIELNPASAGVYHAPEITSESGKVASQLLQENHDRYHMYFNPSGFHNHIAHHLLTIYALGATPGELNEAFDHNKGYQRPLPAVQDRIVEDMTDREKFKQYLGKERYFHDYADYFRKDIDEKGWEAVLNEHLFAGDEHAERLLTRLYAGFLHPIIHLGFGVEFKQPAIIVEALAQTATHDNWIAPFLLTAEEKARTSTKKSKSLVQLIHEAQKNPKLRSSAHWDDGNKIRDGVLVRAPDEMLELASQWTVKPEELKQKTAEMIGASIYFTGAAQHPPKKVKFDFYYMHCVNSSIFFSTLIKEPWLSTENKCRILEWKGRIDLALYVSRACPELLLDEIKNYKPKNPEDGWAGIVRRVDALPDDGHASKLVRAIAHGEQACKPYEGEADDVFPLKGNMWELLGHMAIDSVEGSREDSWVRSAGFEQAWQNVPERAKL
ncbi:uncharacterized protein A1O9_01672 [Exophiala aquamarina CBS 119918]|uniref:HypA protein n=1 Tax=Exophiala aquamarina CBS 119918 TaxID=1182545 RepID=A0A072PUC6_9EURO|nr:uncharacterized protein A1O9_01672 [Exophiala aquamarina CBS 119918]KEF63694.1 hypothetical protein A1O9_01672 [Exophiala aquamarina CBS 119918]